MLQLNCVTVCFLSSFNVINYIIDTGSPDILKQSLMPIVDRQTCNNTQGFIGDITPHMVCSGWEEGKNDACQVFFCSLFFLVIYKQFKISRFSFDIVICDSINLRVTNKNKYDTLNILIFNLNH